MFAWQRFAAWLSAMAGEQVNELDPPAVQFDGAGRLSCSSTCAPL
jgi:hypothetical protein